MHHRDARVGLVFVMLWTLVACGGTPSTAGPTAPTNVAAVAEPAAITVSWDHGGEDLAGFVVEREVAASAGSVSRASVGVERVAVVGGIEAAVRSFTDDSVDQGVSYRYAVAAIGTNGAISTSSMQSGGPVRPHPAVVTTCDDPSDEPIADAVLAAGIRDALGIPSGPTCADLLDLTWLHLSWPDGDPVTSLEGLQYATHLRDLGLDGNAVASVAPLAGLGALRWLWIGGNPIADVSPLASLHRLRGLALWGSEVTSIDPLQDLVHLEDLYLGGVPFDDVGVLAGMSALRRLHVQGANVTDLDFVANHPDLVELDVSSTQIDDDSIPVLETLTHLESLGIGDTGITDVSFLDGYTDLHTLWAWNLDLADVTPITTLTGLRSLDVGGLGIGQLSFLGPFDDLESISAWGNAIVDVSVLQDKDLEYANLAGNQITDLSPLVANTSLGAGDRVEVQFNCLDLSPGSSARIAIQALVDRGVDVAFEPQSEGC